MATNADSTDEYRRIGANVEDFLNRVKSGEEVSKSSRDWALNDVHSIFFHKFLKPQLFATAQYFSVDHEVAHAAIRVGIAAGYKLTKSDVGKLVDRDHYESLSTLDLAFRNYVIQVDEDLFRKLLASRERYSTEIIFSILKGQKKRNYELKRDEYVEPYVMNANEVSLLMDKLLDPNNQAGKSGQIPVTYLATMIDLCFEAGFSIGEYRLAELIRKIDELSDRDRKFLDSGNRLSNAPIGFKIYREVKQLVIARALKDGLTLNSDQKDALFDAEAYVALAGAYLNGLELTDADAAKLFAANTREAAPALIAYIESGRHFSAEQYDQIIESKDTYHFPVIAVALRNGFVPTEDQRKFIVYKNSFDIDKDLNPNLEMLRQGFNAPRLSMEAIVGVPEFARNTTKEFILKAFELESATTIDCGEICPGINMLGIYNYFGDTTQEPLLYIKAGDQVFYGRTIESTIEKVSEYFSKMPDSWINAPYKDVNTWRSLAFDAIAQIESSAPNLALSL